MNLLHFLGTCDLNRPAEEIAVDLLWLATGERLPLEDLTLGTPELAEDRSDLADDTTVWLPLTVTGDTAEQFPDLTGVRYRRIPLRWVTQNRVLKFQHAYPFNTVDVLAELNFQLGTQFTTDDVVDRSYESADEIFLLEVKPESLVWCNTPYPHQGPYYLSSSDQAPEPLLVYVPPAPPPEEGDGSWVPGQTDFFFDSTVYTPTTNFNF